MSHILGNTEKMKISSVFIDKLPDELLQKVIEKLPCKSALQCKAVCKRWLYIISDPYLVQGSIHNHHHLEQSDNDFSIFFRCATNEQGKYGTHLQAMCSIPNLKTSEGKPHLLSFVPGFKELDPESISVETYFKDLLVRCAKPFNPTTYYICNPLTKQWSMIPPSPTPSGSELPVSLPMVGFVCYPYYCNKKRSCFTNIQYNYKLVRFPGSSQSNKFTMEIFCSESGRWSQSEVFSSRDLSVSRWWTTVIAYKGILHWLNGYIEQIIMAYDPLNNVERCRIIDLPAGIIDCIGVTGDRLRISGIHGHPEPENRKSLSVWELDDYNAGKWRLEHKVNLEELVSGDASLVKYRRYSSWPAVKAVAFHPFHVDIVYLSFRTCRVSCSGKVVRTFLLSCNMRKGTIQVVSKVDHKGLEEIVHSVWMKFYPIVHPWWPTPVPSLDVEALSY